MRSNIVHRFSRGLGLLVFAAFVTACGGDGGNGSGYDSVLGAAFEGSESEFEVFEPWLRLRNICENPRSRDRRGTATDEKNFLRSFSNDTYLWYDEIDYVNPADSRYSVAEYFDLMKSFERTPSGNLKDRFHFSQNTEQYLASTRQGTYAGYGFTLATVEKEVIILLAEENAPAGRNGLSRGARIISVEGRTYEEAGENLTDFLHPRGRNPPREYAFEVRDLGATASRTFNMQAATVTTDPVRFTRVIETDSGPVGYLFFRTHNRPSEAELIHAFRELAEAEVTDLVLDLRYNGGGFLDIANQVGFMIAGSAAASGRVFGRLQFNDKHPSIDPFTNRSIDPGYFHTRGQGFSSSTDGVALPALDLSRVFVLVTSSTCSASESIINGLHGIDVEVILIGQTTCGKPYGFYSTDNCGTTYSTINFRLVNDKNFGDYPEGFAPQNATGASSVSLPGCAVADDFDHALGDVNEAQLAAALRYRVDGSCPEPDRLATKPFAFGENPWDIGIMLPE